MVKQTGLGRGLSALMGDGARPLPPAALAPSVAGHEKNLLPLDKLVPGNFQPRRLFGEEDLRNLAESIQKNGVILPVIVRPLAQEGRYEIIAGERRWRASKMLGLMVIPAVIRELSDKEALEFALIENIQRQDLTPLEEADGYLRLMTEFTYTQEDLAARLGKSRSHIANLLRLLSLPLPVKELLHAGSLSMGHARALVNTENAEEIAVQIVKEGLSVRQVEKLAHKGGSRKPKAAKPATSGYAPADAEDEITQIAHGLSHSLGMPVSIAEQNNTGNVTIAFSSLMQLDKILQLLGGKI